MDRDMKAIQKYVRISPQKLREIADAIRALSPEDALNRLRFLNKRGAQPLAKTIKAALANAKTTKGADEKSLKFKIIDIAKGPTYKRWRPVARGAAHGIFKRTSHIRVELESTKEGHGTKSKS